MLNISMIPILDDNYAYILQSDADIAVLDPGEAAPIIVFLEENNLTPNIIFNTHHHGDHIAGNAEIKDKYGCQIIGPEKDKHRIPDMSQGLNEGDDFSFGGESVQIFETPGHTNGHICLYFTNSKVLFSGDTLFSLGCGRLFEGTAEDMFQSFEKLKQLSDETVVYCGHEYTQSNGNFCVSVDGENADLQQRMAEVQQLREQGTPTIPTTIGLEKKTNIFMRAESVADFAKYRELKDNF